MEKVEKYLGNKTYMYPNGVLATPEQIELNFPAVSTFTHVIITDMSGEMCNAVQNLNALKSLYNIPMELNEDESIAKIEEIINTKSIETETEPSPEERIAAALEFQNLLSL